jgi:hypothetical protein
MFKYIVIYRLTVVLHFTTKHFRQYRRCVYSSFLLVWHPWDQTGAELSYTPYYQTVPILTLVLPTGYFLLLLLYLGCTTNHGGFPLCCLLQLLVQACQNPFLFFLEFLQFIAGMLKDQGTVDHESS